MKSLRLLLLASLLATQALADAQVGPWTGSVTSGPWTRWWWPASAVEPAQITAQLEAFAAAGIDGVEITPIYGARGAESRFIDFLSPRWVAMLEHTSREARRLHLGVDMATGTGWPFGGPWVSESDGSSTIKLVDGKLTGVPTAMKVKRPAPGGEGRVLDPYSTGAMDRYLAPFTKAFANLPRGAVRSQFHDSFEYYNASWSPSLPAAFEQMNGYDIQTYAAEILGTKPMDAEMLGRIKGDYRRTLGKLHFDYVKTWVDWSHAQGFKARNQAHGAPGNLLDLYSVSDMPETESFGTTALPIVGLHPDAAGVSVDADPPLNMIGRLASSAAHVTGKPLVSSETLTWLRENFRESPSAAKPQLDRLFAAGINHIFYHGTVYSPADAAWPGWFFYAATQLNPENPLWHDFGAMHDYVRRVQSSLQNGKPANDILLYWPYDDLSDDANGLMRQYGMHENGWLVDSSLGRTAQKFLDAGYTFDFISDAQLALLRVERGAVVAPGGRYRVIVVPQVRRMSVDTLSRLVMLKKQGASILFESLPDDVPGLGRLEARRAELKTLLGDAALLGEKNAASISSRLAKLGILPEPAAAAGMTFIRRARADGIDYFLANLSANNFDGWLQLSTRALAALHLDPLSGNAGIARLQPGAAGNARVYLQLASGESAILRTYTAKPRAFEPKENWRYLTRRSAGSELPGAWQLEFIKGGPTLPAAVSMEKPANWATLADPEAERFSGTARYRIGFDLPAGRADGWLLDLGDVRETARVRLNGHEVATLWSVPFTLRLDAGLLPRGNVLEIEVTNLPANRVRDLDLRKIEWKIMKDINLVSLKYRPLDASTWEPAPSGLLGPVRLVPMNLVRED